MMIYFVRYVRQLRWGISLRALVNWLVKESMPMSQRSSPHFLNLFCVIYLRNVTKEWELADTEKLLIMTKEYEIYKDQWGLNLHYSHTAGPAKNFSVYSSCLILQSFANFPPVFNINFVKKCSE